MLKKREREKEEKVKKMIIGKKGIVERVKVEIGGIESK